MDLIAYFIFYNKATGPQARLAFHPDFKHINVIVYDGDSWIMVEYGLGGYIFTRVNAKAASSLFRAIKHVKNVTRIVVVEIKKRAEFPWRPFLARSCNEICRHATGIDVGFTFNPVHFYTKMLKYRHKRNYRILALWRPRNGLFRRK